MCIRDSAKSILGKLAKLATDRWVGEEADTSVSSGAPAEPAPYVRIAMRDLADLHRSEGELERVTELLLDVATLPFPRAEQRALRHEAAAIYSQELKNSARAIEIYEKLFGEDPSDEDAVRALVEILEREGRPRDLLGLAKRRVAVATHTTARLALRIETARIEAALGDGSEAAATLRENLAESPRHAASVEELVVLLERDRKFHELETLYAAQAERAEADVDLTEAAELFEHAAEVALTRLADSALAAQHYRRVVALEPRASALDALATLSTEAAEHGGAADYLERLRHVVREKERTEVVLRMVLSLIHISEPTRPY